jgi:hypothetical protein
MKRTPRTLSSLVSAVGWSVAGALVLALTACGDAGGTTDTSGVGDQPSAGGAAGSSAAPLAGCPSFTVEKLADDDAPLGLLAAGQDVFWAAAAPVAGGTGYEHRLRRAPRGGGEVVTLYTSQAEFAALGEHGDEVVFLEVDLEASTSRLLAVPKAGGEAREIATLTKLYERVDRFGFAVDQGAAYGIGVNFEADAFIHEVFRIDLADGSVRSLATFALNFVSDVRALSVTDEAIALAYTGGDLYRLPRETSAAPAPILFDLAPAWTSTHGVDGLVGVGAETLVLSNGVVRRIDATGNQTPVVEDTDAYRALAQQGPLVAWGERSHDGIERLRARAEDGSLCVVATTNVVSVLDLRFDGDRLFWANTASREAGGGVWSARW